MTRLLTTSVAALMLAGAANAATITANNATSEVIPGTPVLNDDSPASSEFVKAFTEGEGLVYDFDIAIDGGVIAAGTVFDSHMVFLNAPSGRVELDYSFSFSETILGIITSTGDVNASTGDLGSPDTVYGTLHGLEGNDTASFAGNTVAGTLIVTQPGDWFRVITESPAPVPVPAAGALMLLGLGALGAARKGRKEA